MLNVFKKNKQCIMASNLWGGENRKINPNGGECGAPLPNCSVSSSSETVESSSSEYIESSSSEKSKSSSSENKIDSSSSDDDDNKNSSSSRGEDCGTGTGHCPSKEDTLGRNTPYDAIECTYSRKPYWNLEGIGECGTEWVPKSNSKRLRNTKNSFVPPTLDPRDLDKMAFSFKCVQSKNLFSIPNGNYNHLLIYSNIPYAVKDEFIWLDYYCYKTLDDCLLDKDGILMTHPNSFWCGGGNSTMTDYGCSIIHYDDGEEITGEGMDFLYTNEDGFSLSDDFPVTMLSNLTLDYISKAIRKAAKNAEMTIYFLKDGTSVYPNIEAMDEACAEWQKRGDDDRSSSSIMQSSSSREMFSSSIETESCSSSGESSSSSQKESSSSNYESSSSIDEESSCSMKIEIISSSSIEDKSSSSVYGESSSSDFVYSSSDATFVAGEDQVYYPDQIFKDGLDNMEAGKCYSLNPARGTQYGWISTNAQDSWWWREVDCETGNKVDNNRVGACPGFPLDNVPSNPRNACFAYNGTCYKCNPARGSECSNSWLWQGSFTPSNVGWWYEEVNCEDPFGDDFDGQCPDKFYLEKSEVDNHDYLEIKNYTIEYSVSQKDYDALGRRLNGKRPKFLRSFNKRENKIVPTSKNTFDVGNIIYIPIEKIGLSHNFLAKEEEKCPDYPCGDIGKDYGVGNDVGVYCGHPCTKPIMENGFLRIEVTNKRQTGSCGKNNPKYTITFKLPATATIKRKKDYYVAPIGYKMGESVVTKDDYEAVERHEIGHMESYSCLEDKNMFKSHYEFVLENVCKKNIVCDENDVLRDMVSSIKNKMDPKTKNGIDELVRYNNELWQRMCGWYHETFSHEDGPGGPGKPAELTCPSTNTLLKKKYDLTGCEVH